MVQAVEIEIDGQHNECLRFRPLQRAIRGRFDMARVAEPLAKVEASNWPLPIPSQRLGIDADGNGYLVEPLYEPEFAPLKEKIQKKARLEPAVQNFDKVHLPSWYFWIKQAVESGLAKIVKGKLPDKIEGTPRLDFINAPSKPSTTDRLTAAIERQNALMEKVLVKLGEK